MRFYHHTAAAKSILSGGFRNATGKYGTDRLWTGVFVSDRPIDAADYGPLPEGTNLRLDTAKDEAFFEFWEWPEEDKGYREWLIPAAVLNEHCTVKRCRS
jgi:hypothetical protein